MLDDEYLGESDEDEEDEVDEGDADQEHFLAPRDYEMEYVFCSAV
jgi:hypothetical protein